MPSVLPDREVYRPPLLILHGLFGSRRNWRTVEGHLSTHFTVFAIDARNHGDAPRAESMSYPEMAADVVQLLDARRIPAAHLLGHSMGGKTAMEVALAYPTRVDALVVVDIAPRAYPRGHDKILESMLAVRPEEFRDRRSIEKALSRTLPDPRIRGFLLTNVRRDQDGLLRWAVNLQAIRDNYGHLVAGLRGGRTFMGRVLFVLGTASDYVTAGDRKEILQFFPRAEFCDIDGANHWVHADQPSAFLSAVEEFLARPGS